MEQFGYANLCKIKNITRDMSSTYDLVINDLCPRAVQVTDKFHVLKYVYASVGDVRKQTIKDMQNNLTKGKTQTTADKEILRAITLLQNVNHAITQSPDKWDKDMQNTMNQVFAKHRKLQTACEISQKFKQWYDYQNHIKPIEKIQKELHDIYKQTIEIEEFNGVVKMFGKHEKEILNYFRNGLSNSKAENPNGKLQRFISANFGIKDNVFFLYRTAGYFS
jgi:transposase